MLAVAKKSAQCQMRERIEINVGDMHDLPFEDNSFDVVLSTYSLCPLCAPAKAATKLYRVTRPGGCIAIAHSTGPETPFVKWMADHAENIF
ncbi:MAG TPA: class I SAM-dependent methyltransferase [Psychromonas sp.]